MEEKVLIVRLSRKGEEKINAEIKAGWVISSYKIGQDYSYNIEEQIGRVIVHFMKSDKPVTY